MNNRGFTLIELVATIALLSIISIISFVSVNGLIEDNKVKNCENLIHSIKSDAKEYVSDNRYKSSFVSNVTNDSGKKKIEFNAKKLLDLKYLTEEIINPFDNEEIIDANDIKITVILWDDYTAKEVTVSRNGMELECSSDRW